MSQFDAETIKRIADVEEVDIETQLCGDAAPRRTTIWVVVVHGDVYVRSYRAVRGIWYQEIRANPDAALWVGAKPYLIRAVPVTDPTLIAKVSDAYLDKYRNSPYVFDMVRDDALPTTLRLEPR